MIVRWVVACALLEMGCAAARARNHAAAGSQLHSKGDTIPMEHQVSLMLDSQQKTSLSVVSERSSVPLSVTVTPCTAVVNWTVYFSPSSFSIPGVGESNVLQRFSSRELKTFQTLESKIGVYIIELIAASEPTQVQVFASSEPEPPHQARMAQQPRMRLQRRLRRRKVTVKWDQSPIDPHVTEYCLVVSTKSNFTSLCGARGAQGGDAGARGGSPPRHRQGNPPNTSRIGNNREKDNILISCVGSRTHHNVENLKHGEMYYFSLFAVNKQTNLTFPYGSTFLRYDKRRGRSGLRDGTAQTVNLKKMDGTAVFRFKLGELSTDTLMISVMPCGGAVDVEVSLGGAAVVRRRRVDSYERLLVPGVRRGQRYIITVSATNGEELTRTTAVKVLATTKQRIPLPELPSETEVREYSTMTTCDSVTVGWLPSPDPTAIRYCVVVGHESRRRDPEAWALDQCALETRLRKSADYHVMHCKNWNSTINRKQAMTQKIPGLKPGRRYVVQVTVKKLGGRTLSYNLLTVHTKPTCT